jgi:hypothetical protein
MTDIDLEGEISIEVREDAVTATLQLDGSVSTEWQRRFDGLAKAQGIPAMIMPSTPDAG